jgi:hypothetical protein
MRPHLAALALVLFPANVQAAADAQMSWVYSPPTGPDALAQLAYGVPGTEDGLLILDCQAGSGRLLLKHWTDAAPQGVVVVLRAGRAVTRHPSTVSPNDIAEGVAIDTPVGADDRAIQAFRTGAPLTIEVGRERIRLPPLDRTMGEPFFKACGER